MRPLVVITLLGLSIVGCAERPWHGIVRSPADPAPALVLAGAADRPVTRLRLDSLRGEVVVLYFGYTHCPDVCPTTLADWARAKRALGADTTGIRWIFVSVDPTRDSPAEAHGYARQFDPAFMGTAPTDAELALLSLLTLRARALLAVAAARALEARGVAARAIRPPAPAPC